MKPLCLAAGYHQDEGQGSEIALYGCVPSVVVQPGKQRIKVRYGRESLVGYVLWFDAQADHRDELVEPGENHVFYPDAYGNTQCCEAIPLGVTSVDRAASGRARHQPLSVRCSDPYIISGSLFVWWSELSCTHALAGKVSKRGD